MAEGVDRIQKARRAVWIGLFINLTLTALKLTAGILGMSAAMVADAVHSLSDFATDTVVILAFRVVGKPVDESHDYGHGKFETLAAAVIGIMLLGVAGTIAYSGAAGIIGSFRGRAVERPGWIAFGAGLISILVKELLYRYSARIGEEINSRAVVANAWHHRSDALSSVGAVLGIGGAIVLGEGWSVLDPIAAVVVSAFIIRAGFAITWNSMKELLEASLSEENEKRILDIIKSVPGAEHPHNLRTRMIGGNAAIDVHIRVAKDLKVGEAHDIATRVEQDLKTSLGEGTFVSVHVEPHR